MFNRLPRCRTCGAAALSFIEHYKESKWCDKSCSPECEGHWERDGEPEWYCHTHFVKAARTRRRKRLTGYACDHCGTSKIQHDPPPPCPCKGARKERELVARIGG